MTKSSTSILIVVLLLFTLPLWIALAGGLFGLLAGVVGIIAGLFAGVIGLIAGIFGAIVGVIAGIFDFIFDDSFSLSISPFHVGFNPILIFLIAILIAVVIRKKQQRG